MSVLVKEDFITHFDTLSIAIYDKIAEDAGHSGYCGHNVAGDLTTYSSRAGERLSN